MTLNTNGDSYVIIGNGAGGGSTVDLEALLQDLADNLAVEHDSVDAGNPLKIGGYATDTQRAQVDNGDRVEAVYTRSGEVLLASHDYITETDRITVVNPPSEIYINFETALTNIPNATPDTSVLIAMDGYRGCTVEVVKTGGTDTFAWTMLSTNDDPATAVAADYYATTEFGFTSDTVTSGASYTASGIIQSNPGFTPRAHRVKITTAGGANDSDYTVRVKRWY